jgi:RNA polymerase sigma-70 factor, ECF subfamily
MTSKSIGRYNAPGAQPAVNYSELSPVELFRACAQKGDAVCWQEFMRRFNPVIARSILRVAIRNGAADNSLIDDLIQETYLKICGNECKLLRTFTPQHEDSAFGFLKVVAARIAQDFFKSRSAEKRAPETKAEELKDASTPSATTGAKDALSSAERAVLIGQIDRTLVAVIPASELDRARRVFWLYYRAGCTASSIASIPALGLTTKGVESLLFRTTRVVRESLCGHAGGDSRSPKGFQEAESF